MRHTIVRYRVTPDRAAENEALVQAVYAELHEAQPAGLTYATYRLDDGVTFVHVATQTDDDAANPLLDLAAFGRFRDGLNDRAEAGPDVTEAQQVGAYRAAAPVRA